MSQPRLLGGRYELDSVIGRGGMAEVYRARDLRLDRIVAIKTLRSDLARDPTFQARFRREAQSAASLNHPSVVAVYDTGEDTIGDSQIPYIVMEYVDGSTLRDLLRENRALRPEKALEITDGILRALDYSHRGQIVHRDIKPANIMLTRNHDVKVMDFGIARAMHDAASTMTQTAQVIGTAQYLSPEQARGERVDARSDIYSTGCLLYELLTGRPPFTGDSPVAIAYQHVREEPVPPSQVDHEIPTWADAIVLKAMAKDADHRYQSATEFRQEIQRVLQGQQVHSTAASTMLMGGGVPQGQHTQVMGAQPQHTQMQRPMGGPTGYDLPPVRYDDQQGDYGRGGGNGKKIALWIALVVVLIGGAGLVGVALSGGDDDKPKTPANVAVPSVADMSEKEAAEALTAKGLKVNPTVERAFDEDVDKDKVIKTDPAADAEVAPGTSVTLTVSRGPAPPKMVAVPGVVGDSLAEAQQKLQAKGLSFTVRKVSSTSASPGTVLKTDPQSGSKVKPGATITVYVAEAAQDVKVPTLMRLPKDAACARLRQLKLQCDAREQPAPDASFPPGTVFQVTPQEGTTVAPGSLVTILIVPKPAPPSPGGPGSPSPGESE
ncbi:Stk1 family PASTA domain-containing Ser/Thr kinase [Actinomadura hibisca]|uniref:Stk1 family PASTA domain-containing Ser/Thr kinase n=1 Tax=Actinomadura hibisca TaxID=68565 RepID=UPI0008338A05|nr:Stk1 family PASTA domain-containing Ser/Thr kinase [Actinomadura hibisca]